MIAPTNRRPTAMTRELTQPANPNWPFLYSVDPKYGIVKNVPVEVTPRVALLPGALDPKPNPQVVWPFQTIAAAPLA